MQRINNDPNGKLLFYPKGVPMNICSECINHMLVLPEGKTLLETGIFTLGHLVTDQGRNIEVALRKNDSFSVHLVANNAQEIDNPLPLRLYPNPEPNDQVIIPENFFNSYYNCHGCTFADSEYWLNPLASVIDRNGIMVLTNPNLTLLLEDEYEEVQINDQWVAALYFDNSGNITHSVKNVDGRIISKYDGYELARHVTINEVDTTRYGNGTYKFYRTK